MSSDWPARWMESQRVAQDILRGALPPPRFGACVYCGLPSGYGLACGAHLDILRLDPTYADARKPACETDSLPKYRPVKPREVRRTWDDGREWFPFDGRGKR